ncbi:DUF3050 domain-containing protein [Sulfurovum mangrovi]|uniref:DUF3050 domain-containing protein n=1 Tax=Sulfurovum mangrovi TaxID=2893889 RepID=UPI001E462A0E|nr:DUF3050 domain-containing protein [Sulfurovum mangrovi]UFH58722.1 DUF3050 domain-containing protein [Sulfurovum mangrovi]
MVETIQSDIIDALKSELNEHPVYKAVESIEDLRCFMEHHAFSVWDFMSLVKFLQAEIAPSRSPWVPPSEPDLCRFINELVLEEESDEMPDGKSFLSHYEIYLLAMEEIGADTSKIRTFVDRVRTKGIDEALQLPDIPEASRAFTTTTFSFISENEPQKAAAALALGREHIIPVMFKGILKNMGINKKQAPIFHYYLERHIHLDEGFHGPLSLRLLNKLCEEDAKKVEDAADAAKSAVSARIAFWDGVLKEMEGLKKAL